MAVGLPPWVAALGVGSLLALTLLLRHQAEMALLVLAATVLLPMPSGLRPALLLATVGVIAVVAAVDDGATWSAVGPRHLAVMGGLVAGSAITAFAALRDDDVGGLPQYGLALVIALVFFAGVSRRIASVGPLALSAGIGLAAFAAGIIVIARLGGLPLVGSDPADSFEGAKSVVFGELGDVNGQALVIMLGLPFLLALALHLQEPVLVVAGLTATAVAALALLVLLSRSSLVGAAVGVTVVMLLMVRLSRARVTLIAIALAGLLVYSLQGIQELASDSSSLASRTALWHTALDFWHQSPYIGSGADGWSRLASEQVRDTPTAGAGGTHNLVLSSLVSTGVVGLAIQLALIGLVLWSAAVGLRRLRGQQQTLAYVCLVAATGAFAGQLARGVFEATGWPGFRTNDLRTWPALLLLAIVAIIIGSAAGGDRARPPAPSRTGPTP